MKKKIEELFENKRKIFFKKCSKKNCNKPGLFKAPKSRNNLKLYIWFCQDHITEYNKSWNYCKNMSKEEIEKHIKLDTVGWRPTWDFSSRTINFKNFEKIFLKYFSFTNKKNNFFIKKNNSQIKKAFEILKLNNETTSFKEVEKNYKKLVKKYHPDRNNGSKEYEEILKKINNAFATLKKFFSERIKLN